MDTLKPVEYFLEEEEKYIKSRKGEPEFVYDEKYGMQPSNIDDPLAFLEQNLLHKTYNAMLNAKQDLLEKLANDATDSELLMLLAYEGFMSEYFRDDYWGTREIPEIVREMQKCLYSIIEKAPVFEGGTLYRFCVYEDSVDFEIGQKVNFSYSLATTTDNWNQNKNRYIIQTLPNKQTKAHCIYRIHNHGNENQVNFLPNTSFIVTDIQECICEENVYKHIYMKEEI